MTLATQTVKLWCLELLVNHPLGWKPGHRRATSHKRRSQRGVCQVAGDATREPRGFAQAVQGQAAILPTIRPMRL
eukprot:1247256-Amphidinium_carterae.1